MTHLSSLSLFRSVPARSGNGRMYSRGESVRWRPCNWITTSSPSTRRQSVVSRAGLESMPTSSRRSSTGTPRCEVPVSTIPSQPPSWQISRFRPPTSREGMATFQCPSAGSFTGTQLRGLSRRAGLCPPSESSLLRPLSSSARKKANCGGAALPMTLAKQVRKLKSSLRANLGKDRPTMPSKVAVSKSTDICRATSMCVALHSFPGRLMASPLLSFTELMQRISRTMSA
mmetsp:Transcript_27714/g.76307  ORF Transcript_27714/g.76307 Transcript_27714/m.76307 type:complete len:229 (-) Transcript_27714:649-1335(-)